MNHNKVTVTLNLTTIDADLLCQALNLLANDTVDDVRNYTRTDLRKLRDRRRRARHLRKIIEAHIDTALLAHLSAQTT